MSEALYKQLNGMLESVRAVSEGRCPKCGANRWCDQCRACGHHSVYVPPILPERFRPLSEAERIEAHRP